MCLHAAQYEAVYIRRLCYPLSGEEITAVQAFAEHACAVGKGPVHQNHVSDEEVVILMSLLPESFLGRLGCVSPVERFLTTRLIGGMLAVAGQADDEGHRFTATTADERLLLPLQELSPADFTPAQRPFISSRIGVSKRGVRWDK
jgi:hypothetical protein